MEYIFPLSSLHVLRKAKSKQATRGTRPSLPAHHTRLLCESFLLNTPTLLETFYRLSVDPGCPFPGQNGLTTSGSCPHSNVRGAEHHSQKGCPFSLRHILGAAYDGFISPNLFLMRPVMHMMVPKTKVCLGTSASPRASES